MWGNRRRKEFRLSDLSFVSFKIGNIGPARIRVWPFWILVILVGLLLTIRLGQLTIVEGHWRRQLADENRILTLPLAAQRGIITDRNGLQLTRNSPLYRRQVPGTNPAELDFEAIDRETALLLLSNPIERVSFDVMREYPCGQACAPVLGYMAEITQSELTDKPDYRLGELVGKIGAEKAYERILRGQSGEEYLEVNANGQAVRTVGTKQPQSGNPIKLSIDAGLQQVLYEALGEQSGAVVALDPASGEILALVSKPIFNPEDVGSSLLMEGQPFFNRATSGNYAPGSTFKLVTAIAGLESGKIDENTLFEDTGELVIGEYRFGNWLYEEHGRTEGAVNIVKALARSNDIFFYHAGELVGPELLAEWAGQLGLGKTWGLTEWGEASGLVPTPGWKQTQRNERWFLGNTYHMSIGQGDVLTTPLQVAVMTAGVATGGVICPPHLLIDETRPACLQLNLNDKTRELLLAGLTGACEPGGTGSPFFDFSPKVACKTGTAQQGGEEDLPHAWFTVMAPAEDPTIVITVLVERGGQGSQVAAPIAKKGLEYWLNK